MARNWIKSAIKKPGSFSAAASRAGESTAQFASDKAAAPGKTGQRARLAETLMKMNSKGKSKGGKVSSLPGMNKPAMRPDNPNDTPAMERRERRAGIRT